MNDRHDAAAPTTAARAIERVLRAELEAEAGVAQARQQAQVQLEGARAEALATVNRALERVARWQRQHAELLERRLQALRAQAAASAGARQLPDRATSDAAVRHVAGLLTGAADESGG